MPGKRLPVGSRAAFAILTLTVLVSGTCMAAEERLLHTFGSNGGTDGDHPQAALILHAGNLYGTTADGGPQNVGTVFELRPKAGGLWTEKVLYSFKSNSKDGEYPTTELVFDAGNLYGTTTAGGADNSGTVFELSKASGKWTEKVLYSFGKGNDGKSLHAGLITDSAGNLYGTTAGGGADGSGTVFELTKAGGKWTEKVLYSFGNGKDGQHPYAGLVSDSDGNLYGTTFAGGADGLGTVFELTKAGGDWTEKVLHSFNKVGNGGYNPTASLIFDTHGNLYGTALGAIFELKPKTGGGWTEKVLANIITGSRLVFDATGDLFGTTYEGGTNDSGTIFELTPEVHGKWTIEIAYSFDGFSGDGAYPDAGLIIDASGNLYGTTYEGGNSNLGTVYEFTP